jgi:hypothetical protein
VAAAALSTSASIAVATTAADLVLSTTADVLSSAASSDATNTVLLPPVVEHISIADAGSKASAAAAAAAASAEIIAQSVQAVAKMDIPIPESNPQINSEVKDAHSQPEIKSEIKSEVKVVPLVPLVPPAIVTKTAKDESPATTSATVQTTEVKEEVKEEVKDIVVMASAAEANQNVEVKAVPPALVTKTEKDESSATTTAAVKTNKIPHSQPEIKSEVKVVPPALVTKTAKDESPVKTNKIPEVKVVPSAIVTKTAKDESPVKTNKIPEVKEGVKGVDTAPALNRVGRIRPGLLNSSLRPPRSLAGHNPWTRRQQNSVFNPPIITQTLAVPKLPQPTLKPPITFTPDQSKPDQSKPTHETRADEKRQTAETTETCDTKLATHDPPTVVAPVAVVVAVAVAATEIETINSKPNPIDSRPNPIDSKPNPLNSKPNPIDSKPNPIDTPKQSTETINSKLDFKSGSIEAPSIHEKPPVEEKLAEIKAPGITVQEKVLVEEKLAEITAKEKILLEEKLAEIKAPGIVAVKEKILVGEKLAEVKAPGIVAASEKALVEEKRSTSCAKLMVVNGHGVDGRDGVDGGYMGGDVNGSALRFPRLTAGSRLMRRFSNHYGMRMKSTTGSSATTPNYIAVLVRDLYSPLFGFDRALFWNLPHCHHDPVQSPDLINVLATGILTLRCAAEYDWNLRFNQEIVHSATQGKFSGVIDLPVSPGDVIRVTPISNTTTTTTSTSTTTTTTTTALPTATACLVLEFTPAHTK